MANKNKLLPRLEMTESEHDSMASWEAEYRELDRYDEIWEGINFKSFVIGYFVSMGIDVGRALQMYNIECIRRGCY